MLLDHHRALIAAIAAVSGGCGDNTCPDPSSSNTCRTLVLEGSVPLGELGFRFGEPLDIDGDGLVDIVAGSRHLDGVGQVGAWRLDGTRLAQWDGEFEGALFGHVAFAVPDLDGDGIADVIASAPHAELDGGLRGVVDAYSSRDGSRIWRAVGNLYDAFGWHVARAGDQNGDGIEDLWVGAPSHPTTASVYLVSGRDGAILRNIPSTRSEDGFGWYVVGIGDLDGDGLGDVAIGAPATPLRGATHGAVTLASSSTGLTMHETFGDLPTHLFGEMLAPLDDIDGDGVPDLAVAAPDSRSEEGGFGTDEVSIISGATGERLHLLTGVEEGELYGRMLATLGDVDGDGLRDLAIGAPLFDGENGRVEIRSARTLAKLGEIRGDRHGWFGWHIASSGHATAEPGLVISALHADGNAGVIEVHELRR